MNPRRSLRSTLLTILAASLLAPGPRAAAAGAKATPAATQPAAPKPAAAQTAAPKAAAPKPASPKAAAPKGATPRRNRPTAAITNVACLGKALGGMENIARVGTIYARYQLEVGGLKGTDVFWRDVRGAMRESLDVPGAFAELIVFDGVRGWRRGPNGAVAPLAGVVLEDVVTDAYLGSYMHIVPGRIPGKVERVGLDRKSGLVKLRVVPQGGTPMTLYLDTLTCLPARVVHSTGDRSETTHLRDWRAVGGIKLPHVIHRTTGDSASDTRATLLEARFDAPLPAGAFAKPRPVVPQPPITGAGP